MLDEKSKNDILKSIELRGAIDDNVVESNPIILGSRNNLNHIAGRSSGLLKIYPSIAKKFKLILSKPTELAALARFEIRCVMCKQVISYPCWYYSIKYVVNHFHYFVCFDRNSPELVNCKCYRSDK